MVEVSKMRVGSVVSSLSLDGGSSSPAAPSPTLTPSPRAGDGATGEGTGLYPKLPPVFAAQEDRNRDRETMLGPPTNLETFDLELKMTLQSLERVRRLCPEAAKAKIRKKTDGRAAGTVLRGLYEYELDGVDPLTMELSMIQRSLGKMQSAVGKVVREHHDFTVRNKKLVVMNAVLSQENRDMKAKLQVMQTKSAYAAGRAGALGSMTPGSIPLTSPFLPGSGNTSPSSKKNPPKRTTDFERPMRKSTRRRSSAADRSFLGGENYGLGGLDLLDGGHSNPGGQWYSKSIPKPIMDCEAEAMGLAVHRMLLKQPQCFWSTLVRHLLDGRGNYRFIVDTSNPLFYRRLPLSREAAAFGLEPLADSMFSHAKPTIDIKRLPPSDERIRPMKKTQMNLGCATRHRGIVSYLGTAEFQKPFVNPALENGKGIGTVELLVGASSTWGQVSPLSISEERLEFFCTQDHLDQWVSIDLLDVVVVPSAYSMVSFHPIVSGYYPRNWVFEASIDGKNWAVIRTHNSDTSLSSATPYALFEVSCPENSFYSHFRVRQIGPNSFGTNELQVTSVEIFGDIMSVGKFTNTPPPVPPPVRPISTAWDDSWNLPQEVTNKPGKKKK